MTLLHNTKKEMSNLPQGTGERECLISPAAPRDASDLKNSDFMSKMPQKVKKSLSGHRQTGHFRCSADAMDMSPGRRQHRAEV